MTFIIKAYASNNTGARAYKRAFQGAKNAGYSDEEAAGVARQMQQSSVAGSKQKAKERRQAKKAAQRETTNRTIG